MLEEGNKQVLCLRFLDGSKEGKDYIYDKQKIITLGRMKTCTIQVDEYGVSRQQCQFVFENGSWYIEDGDSQKHSTNGTW
jgi:pSer/pThr/pTyr-binding forkhead associated (FHA) protein